MSYKRKGFTLVELLIVIVVIGILSAMMMLSSTEATTSAKASNIVSNLRNLKTAALAFYTDHLDSYNTSLVATGDAEFKMDNVVRYLKAGQTSAAGDASLEGYICYASTTGWFVGYGPINDSRIKDKLKGRAKSVQLLAGTTVNGPTTPTSGTTYTDYTNEGYAWMIVLDMSSGSSTQTTTPTQGQNQGQNQG